MQPSGFTPETAAMTSERATPSSNEVVIAIEASAKMARRAAIGAGLNPSRQALLLDQYSDRMQRVDRLREVQASGQRIWGDDADSPGEKKSEAARADKDLQWFRREVPLQERPAPFEPRSQAVQPPPKFPRRNKSGSPPPKKVLATAMYVAPVVPDVTAAQTQGGFDPVQVRVPSNGTLLQLSPSRTESVATMPIAVDKAKLLLLSKKREQILRSPPKSVSDDGAREREFLAKQREEAYRLAAEAKERLEILGGLERAYAATILASSSSSNSVPSAIPNFPIFTPAKNPAASVQSEEWEKMSDFRSMLSGAPPELKSKALFRMPKPRGTSQVSTGTALHELLLEEKNLAETWGIDTEEEAQLLSAFKAQWEELQARKAAIIKPPIASCGLLKDPVANSAKAAKAERTRGSNVNPLTERAGSKEKPAAIPPPTPPSSSSSSSDSSSESQRSSLKSISKDKKEKGKKSDKEEEKDKGKKGKKSKKHRTPSSSSSSNNGKTSDKVVLDAFPTAPQFRGWRQNMKLEVVAASKMSRRKTTRWINEVERTGTTFESLRRSGKGFSKLDSIIASAGKKIFKGELGRTISKEGEVAMRDHESLLTGRQLLFLMYAEFSEDLSKTTLFAIDDLMALNCKTEAGLKRWQQNFDSIVELHPELQEDMLIHAVTTQLSHIPCLEVDFNNFERFEQNDPQRTHRYITKAVSRFLRKLRLKEQRKQIQELRNAGTNALVGVIAGKEDKDDKKKSKKKDKDKSKGQDKSGASKSKASGSADPVTAAPAVQHCYNFAKSGSCKEGDNCKYEHIDGDKLPAQGKGKGKGKRNGSKGKTPPGSRAPSPGGRSDDEKAKIPCSFHKKGRCNAGAACKFSHAAVAAGLVAIAASLIAPASGLPIFALAAVMQSCITALNSSSSHAGCKLRFREPPFKTMFEVDEGNTLLTKGFYQGVHSTRRHSGPEFCFADEEFASEDHIDRRFDDLQVALGKAKTLRADLMEGQISPVLALVSPVGFIADTGAALHLKKWDDGIENHYKGPLIQLSTAAGITDSSHCTLVPIPSIGSLEMHLLKDSPSVISVGKLNKDHQIGFQWLWDELPYFILPGGRKVALAIIGDVPVITEQTLEQLRDLAYYPQIQEDSAIAAPAGQYEAPIMQTILPGGELHPNPAEFVRLEDLPSAPPPAAPPGLESEGERRHNRPLKAWFEEHSATHLPAHADCPICAQAKQRVASARVIAEPRIAQEFGGRVHLDSIGGELATSTGFRGERFLHSLHDDFTRYPFAHASKTKSGEAIAESIRLFAGSQLHLIKKIRIDGARENKDACRSLEITPEITAPYRHESHGRAEAFNRVLNQGTRSALLQSGLDHKYWPLAAPHFAFNYARSPNPQLPDHQTPFFARYAEEHNHTLLPFGRGVFYIMPNPQERGAKWDPSSRKGIVVGCHADDHRSDGSIVVIDFNSYIEDSDAIPRLIRTKSYKLTPELFPVVLWNEQVLLTQAALRLQGLLPTIAPPVTADDPAPPSEFPEDDWRRYRPLKGKRKPGTLRPDDIIPEVWKSSTKAEKIALLKSRAEAEAADPTEDTELQQGGSSSSSAAPNALPALGRSKVLIEFCCDSDSNLFVSAHEAGFTASRVGLTQADLSTPLGLQFVLDLIESFKDHEIHLFAAIPCTPWSAWQNLNESKGSLSFKRKLRRDRLISKWIVDNWFIAAKRVKELRGFNYYEWPRHCLGWHLVDDKFPLLDMVKSFPDGCQLGVMSASNDMPLLKPWAIASSNPQAVTALNCKVCSKDHEHGQCAGQSTRQSGHYPKTMTDFLVSTMAYTGGSDLPTTTSITTLPAYNISNLPTIPTSIQTPIPSTESCKLIKDLTRTVSVLSKALRTATFTTNSSVKSSKQAVQCHRVKDANTETTDVLQAFALVHKLLSKSDPEYHTPGARESLEKELGKLKGISTWAHDNPEEWDVVRRRDRKATVSRLFPITSLKHAETANPVYKSRIVLQGSNVKDSEGNNALFGEISSTPSNLNTFRHGVTYGALTNAQLEVADAIGAYTQHQLTPEDGDDIYTRLPREWLPESARNMKDPCFKMLRPLYGHPAAGRIWERHLQKVIAEESYTFQTGSQTDVCKWEEVPGYPNSWTLARPNLPVTFLTVYVDDFLLVGQQLEDIWKSLRTHIDLSEPAPISRVLGCNFIIEKDPIQPTITRIIQEMRDFFASCCEKYEATPGSKPLKPADCPFFDLDPDVESDPTGVMKEHAASLLMKPFYGARCCRPELLWTITFLARYVTVWNTTHDKMLHRLYCYIRTTLDTRMVSVVDSRDVNTVTFDLYPDADFAGCKRTRRSTSGNWFELGAGTSSGLTAAGLEWSSKRQTATATSTSEAEMSSAASILKNNAIPALSLWERLLQRPIISRLLEDNQATLKIIESGYSAKLRHMGKTQGVELAFVSDCCRTCGIKAEYINTNFQKGDFLTKGLASAKHCEALKLVNIQCQLCGNDSRSDSPNALGCSV